MEPILHSAVQLCIVNMRSPQNTIWLMKHLRPQTMACLIRDIFMIVDILMEFTVRGWQPSLLRIIQQCLMRLMIKKKTVVKEYMLNDSLATSLVLDKNKSLIHVSFTYTISYTAMNVHMYACVLTDVHKHIQILSPLILKICHHFESIAFKTSI